MKFLQKKTFAAVKEIGASSNLSKTLGSFDLILLGLGAIIGSGVFTLTGIVAASAGPAVMVSYGIAGVTCIFVALAYTELATMLPTSGSIYTYSYVAFGEIFAWLMASVIILELVFASGAIAASWSGYVQSLLISANLSLPSNLTKVPLEGGIINLPALLITAFAGFILYLGTKDLKRLNIVLVVIKMAAIFAFTFFAAPHFDATNWDNFMPFGLNKVLVGSSILFFAYTGFGTLATAAEECKNPKRNLIIGIIGSLILSTIIYIIVAGLLTGILPYQQLDNPQALAYALAANNSQAGSAIVASGAIGGMTTVLMMNIYGVSRIFYVVARDGLLPKSFSKLHPKYHSPHITIILFTSIAGLLGAFCPAAILCQLSSMGALLDYMVVAIIVMLFRITLPEVSRPFKCPVVFLIAPIALVACTYLLFKQIIDQNGQLLLTGRVLACWLVITALLYIIRHFSLKIGYKNQ